MNKSAPAPRLDRWATLNDFVDNKLPELIGKAKSPAAAVVWFALFRGASGRTGEAQAGSRYLADKTGLSRQTVVDALRTLTEANLIKQTTTGRVIIDHSMKQA